MCSATAVWKWADHEGCDRATSESPLPGWREGREEEKEEEEVKGGKGELAEIESGRGKGKRRRRGGERKRRGVSQITNPILFACDNELH